MDVLKEWSGMEYNTVLFDSDTDGDDYKLFHSKILKHSHLYFIVIDTEGNIFGHYHPSMIDKIWKRDLEENNEDDNIFIFTLKNKENSVAQRFIQTGYSQVATCTLEWGFWSVSNHDYYDGVYCNCNFGSANRYSYKENEISGFGLELFDGATPEVFTNETGKDVEFTPQRLIVIEMK